MKNKFKYILVLVSVVTVIVIINVLLNRTEKLEELSSQVENVREINEHDFRVMGESFRDKIYEKYDTVQFGHYMQGIEGNKKTPIDWIVLDKRDDKVLLFSKYILDLQNFNDEYIEISWADCSLRKWLNSEFYNVAFTGKEKKQILETTNENKGYKDFKFYYTEDSEDTIDRVFLLSQDEINIYFKNDGIYDDERYKESQNLEYGVYIPSIDNATSKATDYAISQYMKYYHIKDKEEIEDVLNYAFHMDNGGVFDYWLRNFAKNDNANSAAAVAAAGYLRTYTYDDYTLQGVRPAIWVSLN